MFERELGETAWGLLCADIGRSLKATKHTADLSAGAPPVHTLDRDGAFSATGPSRPIPPRSAVSFPLPRAASRCRRKRFALPVF